MIYLNPYTLGQISFKVRVSNSCGFSNWATFTLNVNNCNSNGFLMRGETSTTYMIYPNPSKDMVYIDLRDQNNVPEKKAIALSTKGAKALKEEACRRTQWHDPIPQILAEKLETQIS